MMASSERVHPDCVNASNPYHHCNSGCLEKINQGLGRKDKKKSGSIIGASLSFRKKKSESQHQPQSINAIPNGSFAKSEDPSPRSPFSAKHVIDVQSTSENNSFVKDSEPSEIVPAETVTSYAFGTLAKQKTEKTNPPVVELFDASLSGNYDSDVDDSISVVSDVYVTIGRYNVRPYLSSTLQAILDKYGDIGKNSGLESTSLRSYHMECVCSIVQELQSTNVNQLTKGKVREMQAVLNDVESAQISVSWLRDVLKELMDVVDLSAGGKAKEELKAECDLEMNEARVRIEALEEELALKEEEVRETKGKIEEGKKKLEDLEEKSARLGNEMGAVKRRLDALHLQSLVDELL